jgi:hypothetical protein
MTSIAGYGRLWLERRSAAMTERKPKLPWTADSTEIEHSPMRAIAGDFRLMVEPVTKAFTGAIEWDFSIWTSDDEMVQWGPTLVTTEAAQLAAEDALRDMLTGALKALEGGGDG